MGGDGAQNPQPSQLGTAASTVPVKGGSREGPSEDFEDAVDLSNGVVITKKKKKKKKKKQWKKKKTQKKPQNLKKKTP